MSLRKKMIYLAMAVAFCFFLNVPAALAAPGEWQAEWNAAKQDFQDTTGKKKPSKKILGIRKSSGIENALKKIDEAYKKAKDKPTVENIDKLDALLSDFSEIKVKYLDLLPDTIEDADNDPVFLEESQKLAKKLIAIHNNAITESRKLKKK